MPLSSNKFHVNQRCISHSLLSGFWEILPLFYILNKICLKLGTGAVQKKLLSVFVSFVESSAVKAFLYLQA